MNKWSMTVLAVALSLPQPSASAQGSSAKSASSAAPLRLFLDCNAAGCDFDFIRTNLTWVSYVRDRRDAQVHAIATSLQTGSGGSEVTVHFIGLEQFSGVVDTIRFANPQGTPYVEQRAELLRMLKIGLARYVVRTAAAGQIDIVYQQPKAKGAALPAHDRWNSWVFSLYAGGSASGESQSSFRSASASLSANRITESWKFQLAASGNSNVSTYTLSDTTTYKANTRGWTARSTLVRSMGEHFSSGIQLSGASSSTDNINLQWRAAPTVELDFFPYRDYSRRLLLLSYSVGMNSFDYREVTVYDRLAEYRVDHRATLTLALRQPWGSTDLGAAASAYFPSQRRNRLSVYGSTSVRIARGLEVFANGSYARVRDQLSLPKGEATDEEVLLRLRQLRTDYSFGASVGLSFTFGSAFNNVVNPRMNF